MSGPEYHVLECNALARATPKLWRAVHKADPDGPIWEERYHVAYTCEDKLRSLRRRIIEETAPWFDGSAFK